MQQKERANCAEGSIRRGSSVQKPVPDARDNNFNIIRLIASIFVFAGHMEMIRSGTPLLFSIHSLHEMGVWMLFLISGYLITKSWLSDPHPLRFAIRRFFRLWPPFAVMVLIMVFVTGPLLSDNGVQGYFQSSWWYLYLMNLRFYPVYAQPGVFTNMIEAYVTNGSLWTMPVEAFAYVVTPILACLYGLGRKKRNAGALSASGASAVTADASAQFESAESTEARNGKRPVKSPESAELNRSNRSFHIAAVVTAAAIAFDLYLRVCKADAVVVFYGTELIPAYHLITMYIIGVFFTFEQAKKYLNIQVALVGMCLLIVFESSGVFLQYFLLLMVLPYTVFSFAFAPNAAFSRFGRKIDLTYGIYLYGFFFQQLVVYWQNKHGVTYPYTKTLLLSAIPTLLAALLSFYLVEKPAQRLCRAILKRMREGEERRKAERRGR
ncbi:MAG: acyltransferase [Lachnospiraceae bacterium]|nr:acyltransferase [Lachnospiraceae bacterium]